MNPFKSQHAISSGAPALMRSTGDAVRGLTRSGPVVPGLGRLGVTSRLVHSSTADLGSVFLLARRASPLDGGAFRRLWAVSLPDCTREHAVAIGALPALGFLDLRGCTTLSLREAQASLGPLLILNLVVTPSRVASESGGRGALCAAFPRAWLIDGLLVEPSERWASAGRASGIGHASSPLLPSPTTPAPAGSELWQRTDVWGPLTQDFVSAAALEPLDGALPITESSVTPAGFPFGEAGHAPAPLLAYRLRYAAWAHAGDTGLLLGASQGSGGNGEAVDGRGLLDALLAAQGAPVGSREAGFGVPCHAWVLLHLGLDGLTDLAAALAAAYAALTLPAGASLPRDVLARTLGAILLRAYLPVAGLCLGPLQADESPGRSAGAASSPGLRNPVIQAAASRPSSALHAAPGSTPQQQQGHQQLQGQHGQAQAGGASWLPHWAAPPASPRAAARAVVAAANQDSAATAAALVAASLPRHAEGGAPLGAGFTAQASSVLRVDVGQLPPVLQAPSSIRADNEQAVHLVQRGTAAAAAAAASRAEDDPAAADSEPLVAEHDSSSSSRVWAAFTPRGQHAQAVAGTARMHAAQQQDPPGVPPAPVSPRAMVAHEWSLEAAAATGSLHSPSTALRGDGSRSPRSSSCSTPLLPILQRRRRLLRLLRAVSLDLAALPPYMWAALVLAAADIARYVGVRVGVPAAGAREPPRRHPLPEILRMLVQPQAALAAAAVAELEVCAMMGGEELSDIDPPAAPFPVGHHPFFSAPVRLPSLFCRRRCQATMTAAQACRWASICLGRRMPAEYSRV